MPRCFRIKAMQEHSSYHNNWVYDDNNRLESFGATPFNYDTHGNVTQKTVAGVNSNFVTRLTIDCKEWKMVVVAQL